MDSKLMHDYFYSTFNLFCFCVYLYHISYVYSLPIIGATHEDKISTPKQMFYGKEWKKEGDWLFSNIVAYAEFPPIVPPIMAKASKVERKKAGGFMVAADHNKDIVHPMLRPDLNEDDMKIYREIANKLGIDPTLEDDFSYMQFMNYNQICHLELLTIPPSLLYKD